MQETLARVRQELGSEAVILQTRQLSRSGWIGSKNAGVEITAAPSQGWRPARGWLERSYVPPESMRENGSALSAVAAIDHAGNGNHGSDDSGDWRESCRRKWRNGELSEELIRFCLRAVEVRVHGRAPSEELIREAAVSALSRELASDSSGSMLAGRRILFVGPAGAGKTTTIAKLAALAKTRYGLKVALVTLDAYRVGAAEQWQRFAEILDLPLELVHGPDRWDDRWVTLEGFDLVLIDTSARSSVGEGVMRGLLEVAGDRLERHLVLPASHRESCLRRELERFSSFQCSRLIVSKLDEVAGKGVVADLARLARLPISFVTTGPEVPDDIEPADGIRLASWALGYPADASATT